MLVQPGILHTQDAPYYIPGFGLLVIYNLAVSFLLWRYCTEIVATFSAIPQELWYLRGRDRNISNSIVETWLHSRVLTLLHQHRTHE